MSFENPNFNTSPQEEEPKQEGEFNFEEGRNIFKEDITPEEKKEADELIKKISGPELTEKTLKEFDPFPELKVEFEDGKKKEAPASYNYDDKNGEEVAYKINNRAGYSKEAGEKLSGAISMGLHEIRHRAQHLNPELGGLTFEDLEGADFFRDKDFQRRIESIKNEADVKNNPRQTDAVIFSEIAASLFKTGRSIGEIRDFVQLNGKEMIDLLKKEKDAELLELKSEGDRVYTEEFEKKLNDVLRHEFEVEGKGGQKEKVTLGDIEDRHMTSFSSSEFAKLSTQEKADGQREFVKELGRAMNKLPSETWSFYPQRIMETEKINCSGTASLLGMVLEKTKERSGIKSVEYGHPYGHAVDIITFGDDRLYWADARNGTFEDISDYTKSEDKEGLKVYKINQPAGKEGDLIPWRNIPATSVKEGALSSYFSNLQSASASAEGKFDKVLKMDHSKEELREIQEVAGEVCRDRNLSSVDDLRHLRNIKEVFSGKIDEYQRSEEFKGEIRRLEKIMG